MFVVISVLLILFTCVFTHSSIYSPLITRSLFSIVKSGFFLVFFFTFPFFFLIWHISEILWHLSFSDIFLLILYFLDPSMLLQLARFYSFLCLSNSPLYIGKTFFTLVLLNILPYFLTVLLNLHFLCFICNSFGTYFGMKYEQEI